MTYSYDPSLGTPPSIHNEDRHVYDDAGNVVRLLDCYHRIDVYDDDCRPGDLLDQEIERWVLAFHSDTPGALTVGEHIFIQNFENGRHVIELYRHSTPADEFDGILYFAHFAYDVFDGKLKNIVHDIPWNCCWVGANQDERDDMFLILLASRFF